jgi:hypothetical protein
MALLNTNIGPERVQAFDQPIGNVSIQGAGISSASFLISTSLSSAPVNTAMVVASFEEFVDLFGGADEVADDGYYAVKGYYDNAGSGNQAVIVNVGQGDAEVSTIECVADVSSSLNNKYFYINSAYDRNQYYVWFSVDDAGTDPAVAGKTGIKVDITENETANGVASALEAALDGVADFTASVVTDTVTATNAAGGPATDLSDSTGGTSTGFTFAVTTQGARPTADDYIGDAAEGTGLRALDVIDNVGLITTPGLPLATAYLVHGSLIDYSETVRTEFGATLSTCFSLVAVPKEVEKANTDVAMTDDLTISAITGDVITFSGSPDLSEITAGMILKKAGAFKTVITAVDAANDEITVASVSGLAVANTVTLHMPSAISYKDLVVNNPSRVSAWYFNPVLVLNEAENAEDGDLLDIDPTGHVAGVIARIDANTSIGGPSHAPAGVQFAGISGIKGFMLSISERLDAGPLRLAYINRLTSFPSYGNVVYGGYTGGGAAVTADERLIQVMRTVQFVKASLEPGLIREIWENFSPVTQGRVQASIESFLRNNSYLFPAGLSEDQQFKVISVEPTKDELDEGLLRVRVQLRPNKAVRFIEIVMEFSLPAA